MFIRILLKLEDSKSGIKVKQHQKIREYILLTLKEQGPTTTAELLENVPVADGDCSDKAKARVMAVLLALEDAKLIQKTISKGKKSLLWAITKKD